MKIGINARLLHSEILEGVARYVWETTKLMVVNNPNDQFYFFFDRPYPEKFIISDNIIPVVIGPQARHPLLFYYWFEISLKKAVEKLDLDVFYSGENFTSLSLNIPSVLVVHDLAYVHYPDHIPWAPLWYYRYFIPKFIKKADHIICVSQFVKSDILNHFDILDSEISVGYNALPLRASNESKFNFGQYFLFIGSINPRKNIANVLLAFIEFRKSHSEFKFVFVGRKSSLDAKADKLFNKLLNEKSLIHLNNILDEELPTLIENANALVYVSLFEGFGIPIIEAMALGVPVLTSNVTSMPEVAQGAAIIVNPTNIEEIVSGMISISSDLEIRMQLIEKGIERVKDFSWEDTSSIIWRKLLSLVKK